MPAGEQDRRLGAENVAWLNAGDLSRGSVDVATSVRVGVAVGGTTKLPVGQAIDQERLSAEELRCRFSLPCRCGRTAPWTLLILACLRRWWRRVWARE